MSKKEHHHYVPKFYLKNFTKEEKQIYTYVIGETNAKFLGLSDVCVKKNFYTIPSYLQKMGIRYDFLETSFFERSVETQLKRIIGLVKKLKEKFISYNEPIAFEFTPKDRFLLLFVLIIQYFRGPKFRDFGQKETQTDAIHHALSTYANEYLLKNIATKLNNDYWIIRVSSSGNFFTSDNPVVVIDNQMKQKGEYFTKTFIGERHTVLFYPLTHDIVLEIYDREEFSNIQQYSNTVQKSNEEYEKRLNGYQYLNAKQFIFSYTQDFSLFTKEIKEY